MSLSRPTVAFLPVARTTFDIPLAQEVTRQARARLEGLGLRLIGPDALITDLESAGAAADRLAEARPALLVLFQATFADSTMAQRVAETVDAPLVLWAVPEERSGGRLRLNSLCGINLAAHALTRAGRAYEHLYAAPDSLQVEEKLLPIVRAAGVRQRLASTRIGRSASTRTDSRAASSRRNGWPGGLGWRSFRSSWRTSLAGCAAWNRPASPRSSKPWRIAWPGWERSTGRRCTARWGRTWPCAGWPRKRAWMGWPCAAGRSFSPTSAARPAARCPC